MVDPGIDKPPPYDHETSTRSDEDDEKDKKGSFTFRVIFTVIEIIVLVVLLSVFIALVVVTRNMVLPNSGDTQFSPGDSRIFSYSSFFCDNIILTGQSARTNASMHLIKERPQLYNSHNVSFSSTPTLSEGEHIPYNFYLFSNSSFSAHVCVNEQNSNGQFYIIRGRNNFTDWVRQPRTLPATYFRALSRGCQALNYEVDIECDYFFVFYHEPTTSETSDNLLFNITIQLTRFQYRIPDLKETSMKLNCSLPDSKGSCTIPIPLGSDYQALVVIDIPEDVDWANERVDITWRCEERRWGVGLMQSAILLALFIIGVIATAVIFCGLICVVSVLSTFHKPAPSSGIELRKVTGRQTEV